MREAFEHIHGNKSIIIDGCASAVHAAIGARPAGPRDQASDDLIFSRHAELTRHALALGLPSMPREAFRRIIGKVRHYEKTTGSSLHKGALFFNTAIASLACFDCNAAFHYFELAQEETRLTIGHPDWSLFRSDIFVRHFWSGISEELAKQPPPMQINESLWGSPLSGERARDDWERLTDDTKLAMLFCWFQWVSVQRLQAEHAESASLAHNRWALVADLCVLLETEARQRTGIDQTLHRILHDGYHATPIGDLSRVFQAAHTTHHVCDRETLEAALPVLLTVVYNSAETLDTRLGNALYLLRICRNHVQHRIEPGMAYHADPGTATEVIELLFALCCVGGWN